MSSNEVGYTEGLTVKKYIRGEMNQETIEGPRAQREYVTYFNDVEKNDQESSFYSTTIRKNVTTLEYSDDHWTVLFTLSLL